MAGKTDKAEGDNYKKNDHSQHNVFVRLFIYIFLKMYPVKPKEAPTREGKVLRRLFGCFCILHVLSFVVCLAFIGFSRMMVELSLACFSYSAYLTLREWVICLYVISAFSGIG